MPSDESHPWDEETEAPAASAAQARRALLTTMKAGPDGPMTSAVIRQPPPERSDELHSWDGEAKTAPASAAESRRTELTATFIDPDSAAAPVAATQLPARYQDVRQLGSGGFGEVRRVFDQHLGRMVAMKLLRPEALSTSLSARFLAEIRLTAGLQHPGIVPLYDYGQLDNGRLWYTMAEVRGRTFRDVINEAFSQGKEATGPARRRLLDIFARVCEAVAYAHRAGIIHRDIKPDNVMVGELGRVLVMDWGLARKLDTSTESSSPPPASDSSQNKNLTQIGDILGTPAYMAPEQARGEVKRHGLATDVYALGAMLYHVLSGDFPYASGGNVRLGPPAPLPAHTGPPELLSICKRAMARVPEERYPNAGALAADVEAFVNGVKRREQALAELSKAAAHLPEIARQRAQAEALRTEAQQLLENVQPFDPVSDKLPGWEREDEAERLSRAATLSETQWEQQVHGALAIDPELPEAHMALADYYKSRIVEAERARKPGDADRFEVLLRAHDRGRHAPFLSGMGSLSLLTDPPGARVTLHRYVTRSRRLVPEWVEELGLTPIREKLLPRGSYLLHITAPGRAEVAYPVLLERGEAWNGIPPESSEPYAIPLPREEELQGDEVYVPAGWCWTGDPEALDGLPRQRIWIDGFVVGQFPVTNEEYLAFLNELVAAGREEEALTFCPRPTRGPNERTEVRMAYERTADGQFRLRQDDPAEIWRPRGPAVLVNWQGAIAYAQYKSAQTGLSYRLLNELEREKAARGTDGRSYPWGDSFDPTWTCMVNSHRGRQSRADVEEYPLDESPYGVRGLAGNTMDLCLNVWTLGGPKTPRGRLFIKPPPTGDDAFRSVRGGAWRAVAAHCFAAARHAARPSDGWNTTGLRLARSYQ